MLRAWVTLAAFTAQICGGRGWKDTGLDGILLGEEPTPTGSPSLSKSLPYGSFPLHIYDAGSRRSTRASFGRLDTRQITCTDPGYILACPETDDLPCCPEDFPICCPEPADICCAEGYLCASETACCLEGQTACGEGCCDSGTTCCGDSCCLAGWQCQSGNCVNPQLSMQSVLSVSSVASVRSASVQSVSSVSASRSSESVASISSELAGQDRGNEDANTINTVFVSPSDNRIEYDPAAAWTDTSVNSNGGALCTNGTRVTTNSAATLSFIFSGTSISVHAVPNRNGRLCSIQIDGNAPQSINVASVNANSCSSSTVFTSSSLSEGAHRLVLTNDGGGLLEFTGLTYTGRGAFGTVGGSSSGSNRAAIIGGSVGGVLGALALVGLSVFLLMRHRKKKKEEEKSRDIQPPAPTPYIQPNMAQHSPTHPTPGAPYAVPQTGTPAAGPTYAPYVPPAGASYSNSPPLSPYYGSQGVPSGMSGQMGQQPPWAGNDAASMASGPISPTPHTLPGLAPLPMWVERARVSATSPGTMSSASPAPLTDNNHQVEAPQQDVRNSYHDPSFYGR